MFDVITIPMSDWVHITKNLLQWEIVLDQTIGKKILLFSRGSVFRALWILLRLRAHPWDDFTVEGMYHVGDDTDKKKNYGPIAKVY